MPKPYLPSATVLKKLENHPGAEVAPRATAILHAMDDAAVEEARYRAAGQPRQADMLRAAVESGMVQIEQAVAYHHLRAHLYAPGSNARIWHMNMAQTFSDCAYFALQGVLDTPTRR